MEAEPARGAGTAFNRLTMISVVCQGRSPGTQSSRTVKLTPIAFDSPEVYPWILDSLHGPGSAPDLQMS